MNIMTGRHQLADLRFDEALTAAMGVVAAPDNRDPHEAPDPRRRDRVTARTGVQWRQRPRRRCRRSRRDGGTPDSVAGPALAAGGPRRWRPRARPDRPWQRATQFRHP